MAKQYYHDIFILHTMANSMYHGIFIVDSMTISEHMPILSSAPWQSINMPRLPRTKFLNFVVRPWQLPATFFQINKVLIFPLCNFFCTHMAILHTFCTFLTKIIAYTLQIV